MTKIMLVEDEADFAGSLGLMLKARGFEVSHALDAVAALRLAEKEKPDLAIVDIGLPGFDGIQLVDRLFSVTAPRRIPIIIVSGKDPEEYREKALKAGAVAFFEKPVKYEKLLEAVTTAIKGMRRYRLKEENL
ncbi:MAG: response regulator [Chloroflexi bacterium]|nr:response regulator [Chloroflexota bacterium]